MHLIVLATSKVHVFSEKRMMEELAAALHLGADCKSSFMCIILLVDSGFPYM
jgi:hypothetical protein